MEQSSAKGGHGADELATLSKHRSEQIFEAYLTELYPPVLKTMAGFCPAEPYFVARTEVSVPFSDDEIVKLVFPRYKMWKDELEDDGDPHESAQNFLIDLLPFLAKVLLQDGPYWI